MTRFLTTPAGTWTLAALLAIAIAASWHLDAADNSADWADADAIAALQASEAGTARRHVAGQAVCNQARGPSSEARWTVDGDLVCTTRQGLAVAAAGVQP